MVQPREPRRTEGSDEYAGAAGVTVEREALRCDVSGTSTLQGSLLAPAEARSFVAERICPRHDTLAVAAAALVASEVVAHAALCGEGPITIALECDVTTLTLTVTCSMADRSEASGLCLGDPIAGMIVDRICRASGAMPTEHGLAMWCTIPTGHIPVRTSRPARTSSSRPVRSRPRTIRVPDAPNPQ